MSGRTKMRPSTEEMAAFWARLGPKRQAVCAWDMKPGERLAALARAIDVYGGFGCRDEDGEIFLLAWAQPLLPFSATGHAHFANAGTREQALACWPLFADYARELGFEMLLALLPVCFRHARAFAKVCGFEPCRVLPRAAWLAGSRRLVDAELLSVRIQ